MGREWYRYDAHGRRVNSDSTTLGAIRSYYNQSGQLSFQQDARQGKNLAHVYLAGSLVATREQPTVGGSAVLKFHHTDALGSPIAVTGIARNEIEPRSEYEPYGEVINRPLNDRPGYTGHVEDAQTGLTYMQQRYYDSVVGMLLSVDPITAYGRPIEQFHRYRYANNNPYRFTDPDGRTAQLNWTASDRVELVVTYRIDSWVPGSQSVENINAQFASDFSGVVDINGTQVTVTATAIYDPNATTLVTVLPYTEGLTSSGREETNQIGGDQVLIGSDSSSEVVSHEFGHVSGAGGQYVGDVQADGVTRVTVPGPGNNVMQDLGGPANSQSLREVIQAPTNSNTCATGVTAASGACK